MNKITFTVYGDTLKELTNEARAELREFLDCDLVPAFDLEIKQSMNPPMGHWMATVFVNLHENYVSRELKEEVT